MHELSVVEATVEHLRRVLTEGQFQSLRKIVMRIGSLTCVQEEAIRFAFSLFVESDRLPDVEVEIERIDARVRCNSCGAEFSPDDFFLLCPDCGSADTELICGDELHIVSVEVGE